MVALASPLLVVTPNVAPSVNSHPGHGVEGKPEFVGRMRKGPCGGRNRFRQKAVEISNIFREALGLPGFQISSDFQEGNYKPHSTGIFMIKMIVL